MANQRVGPQDIFNFLFGEGSLTERARREVQGSARRINQQVDEGEGRTRARDQLLDDIFDEEEELRRQQL
jgi:hypothetical protein